MNASIGVNELQSPVPLYLTRQHSAWMLWEAQKPQPPTKYTSDAIQEFRYPEVQARCISWLSKAQIG